MPLEEPVAGEIKFDFALRGIWYLPIEGADSVLDLDSFSFLISGDDWETLQLVEVTIDLASQKAHFSMWDFFPEIPTGNNNGPTVSGANDDTSSSGSSSAFVVFVSGQTEGSTDETTIGDVILKGEDEYTKKVKDIWDRLKKRAKGNEDLEDILEEIESGGVDVEIKIINGNPKGGIITIGGFDSGQIDISDIDNLPTGEGPGMSQEEAVFHEVYEQWYKAKHKLGNTSDDYKKAHEAALAVEAKLDGYVRSRFSIPKKVDGKLVKSFRIYKKGEEYWVEVWDYDENRNISKSGVKQVSTAKGMDFWSKTNPDD